METSELVLILAPLILLQVALAAYALYDIYQRGGTRPPLPTWAWIILVVAGQFWGPLVYFFLGRKEDFSDEASFSSHTDRKSKRKRRPFEDV